MYAKDGATQRYDLGHTDSELQRLERQARVMGPITRRLFEAAGIGPGMRVLDVGSGAGDVSLLLADLVGPTGEVVGTDRSEPALVTARARAAAAGHTNLRFEVGDPSTMTFEHPFDAVVGRYVLMFVPDPVVMLRGVARHVRPGGAVAFHEVDWDGVRSLPPAPLFEQVAAWVVELWRRDGVDARMGMRLYPTFLAAGLPPPTLSLEAVISGAADPGDRIMVNPDLIPILLPRLVAERIVSASEADIATLSERILAELRATDGVVVGRSEIGAWCRLPG